MKIKQKTSNHHLLCHATCQCPVARFSSLNIDIYIYTNKMGPYYSFNWPYKWFPGVTTPMSGGRKPKKNSKTRSKIPTKSRGSHLGVPAGDGSAHWPPCHLSESSPLKPELFAAKRTHLHLGITKNLSSVRWWYASMIGQPQMVANTGYICNNILYF